MNLSQPGVAALKVASAILDSRFGQSPLDQLNPGGRCSLVMVMPVMIVMIVMVITILYCTGWWFGTCFCTT